jgi:hypothetical protein
MLSTADAHTRALPEVVGRRPCNTCNYIVACFSPTAIAAVASSGDGLSDTRGYQWEYNLPA